MRFKSVLTIAAILGAVAVVFGAFGAHALKAKLDPTSLGNWDTATRYQFYHVIAIFICFLTARGKDDTYLLRAAWLFVSGIVLFCGSLYILATRSLFSVDLTWLGPLTPMGGLCFISGWVYLFLAIRRSSLV